MIYIILIIGIMLFIYGFSALKNGGIEPKSKHEVMEFSAIINEKLIIERLDSIEEKIDEIGQLIALSDTDLRKENKDDVEEVIPVTQVDVEAITSQVTPDDLNRQINLMKSTGLEVDEIAIRTGLLKGEVLLRLGLKK